VVTDMELTLNPTFKAMNLAGILFFLAGLVILMGIISAEIYYPSGYSTRNSDISDLGATRPPNSLIYQPSASIFNAVMIVGGLLLLTASFFLFRDLHRWSIVLFPALTGIGVLGVGIFPGNMSPFHGLFALVAFASGGLSAIVSSRVITAPFSYVMIFLGLTTLIFLVFNPVFIPILGEGGAERFVAYPVIIWAMGFGGYLAGTGERP
jgi:hypothetical membrane protein